jgi:hypothetical protein
MRRLLIAGLICLVAWPAAGETPTARGVFWRSLLIPGWGQRYAGRTTSATCFLTAELALWGGYFVLRRIEDVREDNFRAHAAEHARARTAGKDDEYFDDLGFYDSVLQHNLFARYEDGPDAELYPEGQEFFWEWDRETSRLRYRELHNSSRRAERRALYTTGLVVANHLLAAIHAAHSVYVEQTAEAAPNERRGAAVRAGFDPATGRIRIALVRRF